MSEERIKALETDVKNLHAALPALFAFRDNFVLWAKETGVFDLLVQEVLRLVPQNGSSVEVAALRAEIAELRGRVVQLEQPRVVEIPPDIRTALEAIGVEFNNQGTISGFKLATYGAPEGPYYGYIGVDDAGLRIFPGIRKKIGTDVWPDVDVNRNLPVLMGPVVERDGAISWDYDPPLRGEDPNPRPNKTFLMYLGGFRRGGGPRGLNDVGPYMDFGSFEAGRGIRWFVRRPGSSSPDTEVIVQMDAQGLAIRAAGGLRRVTMDGDGRLVAGDPIIEDQ